MPTSTSSPPRLSLADIKPIPRASESSFLAPIFRARLAELEKQWDELKAEGDALNKFFLEHHFVNIDWRKASAAEGVEYLQEVGKCEMEMHMIVTRMLGIEIEHERVMKEADETRRGVKQERRDQGFE